MRRLSLLLLVAFSLLFVPPALPLTHADTLKPAFRRFSTFHVVGTRIFLINDQHLELLDVADPQTPTRIGTTLLCGYGSTLDVVDGYAYVIGAGCFDVIDVHDPFAPHRVGTLPLTTSGFGFTSYRLSVADGLAYLHSYDDVGMRIIDVRDPTTPRLQGTVSAQPDIFSLSVADGQEALLWRAATLEQPPATPVLQYAYRISNSNLEVVAVSDPANLTVVGTLPLVQGAVISTITASRVYIMRVFAPYGMSEIDVTQPATPQVVANWPLDFSTSTGQVVAGRAYLVKPAFAAECLEILDVGSSTPTRLAAYCGAPLHHKLTLERYGEPDALISALVADGTATFAADSGGGLRRLDMTDPTHPVLTAYRMFGQPISGLAVVQPGQSIAVAQSDDPLFTDSGPSDVRLLNPTDLRLLGRIKTDGLITNLAAADGLLCFTELNPGGMLRVFDVQNPAVPSLRGSLNLNARPEKLALANGLVYLASASELRIIDVHDPARPTQLSSVRFSSQQQGQALQGFAVAAGFAYVLGTIDGGRAGTLSILQVIDLTHPTSPTLRGTLFFKPNGVGTRFTDLAIAGNFAFVGGKIVINPAGTVATTYEYYGFVERINLANPDAPTLVPVTPPTEPFSTLGLNSIGLTEPTAPKLLSRYLMPTVSTTAGPRGYSAGPSGFTIHDLNATDGPQLLGATSGWPVTPADGQLVQPHDVQLADGYAYMINGNAMLIVNVSDPTHPQALGHYLLSGAGLPTYTSGNFTALLAFAGNRAYIVDSLTLELVDVSNPAAPQVLGTLPVGVPYEIATALAVSGTFVYLMVDTSLRIFDVSDPAHPVARGQLVVGNASELRVNGSRVTLFGSTLATVDVQNPDQPTLVTRMHAPAFLNDAQRISDGFVWWGGITNLLWRHFMLDVSDPTQISIIGDYAFCPRVVACTLPTPRTSLGAQTQATFVNDSGEWMRLAIFPSLRSLYSRGTPGSSFPLVMHSLPPQATLELRVNGTPVGSFASGDGNVTLALAFEATATAGQYLVSVGRPSGPALDVTQVTLSTDALAVVRTSGLASPSFNVPATTQPIKQQYLPLVRQGD